MCIHVCVGVCTRVGVRVHVWGCVHVHVCVCVHKQGGLKKVKAKAPEVT